MPPPRSDGGGPARAGSSSSERRSACSRAGGATYGVIPPHTRARKTVVVFDVLRAASPSASSTWTTLPYRAQIFDEAWRAPW